MAPAKALLRGREVLFVDAVVGAGPLLAHDHEAAVAQDGEVVGDQGLATAHGRRDLAHATLTGEQELDDAYARRVAERLEERHEVLERGEPRVAWVARRAI